MTAPTGDKLVLSEKQALELIAFLSSSAEISLNEPTHYGTLRLVDAVSRRVVDLRSTKGPSDIGGEVPRPLHRRQLEVDRGRAVGSPPGALANDAQPQPHGV